jgi:hypothetical protein
MPLPPHCKKWEWIDQATMRKFDASCLAVAATLIEGRPKVEIEGLKKAFYTQFRVIDRSLR